MRLVQNVVNANFLYSRKMAYELHNVLVEVAIFSIPHTTGFLKHYWQSIPFLNVII